MMMAWLGIVWLAIALWIISAQVGSAVHLAVRIEGGEKSEADKIAVSHGLVNKGPVGELKDFYHFLHLRGSLAKTIRSLKQHPKVKAVQLQRSKHFQMRGGYTRPVDPHWDRQWQLLNTRDVDSDINVEPAWIQGITGRGVTVAVVDDGLEYSHPDLVSNYNPSSSYDFYNDDNDPYPNKKRVWELAGKHGTQCAGIVAMARDNNNCGVGVAYDANIAGLQLFSYLAFTTDIQEATALNHKLQDISVYSNSWGPSDDGYTVDGPDSLTQSALEMGVKKGRGGKGSVYVWSAGNGGHVGDSCATDGYINSPYTISVGSAEYGGRPAYYDEPCSGKLVVVYTHGLQPVGSHMVTTSVNAECVDTFTGTSAAAPMLAGVVALVLQANPTLTWRDVQYLLVYTANSRHLSEDQNWQMNGAGLMFSLQSGFGAVDAAAMVTRARQWIEVPKQQRKEISLSQINRNASFAQPAQISFNYPQNSNIVYLEHVVVMVTLKITNQSTVYSYSRIYNYTEDNVHILFSHKEARRGDIQIELTSPRNTTSTILPRRSRDFINSAGFYKWPFMSVHFWGEDPVGDWLIAVNFHSKSGVVIVEEVKVVFYGTQSVPDSVRNMPVECSNSCAPGRGCVSPESDGCVTCANVRDPTTLQCLLACSNTTDEINGFCVDHTSNYSYSYKPHSPSSLTQPSFFPSTTEGETASSPASSTSDTTLSHWNSSPSHSPSLQPATDDDEDKDSSTLHDSPSIGHISSSSRQSCAIKLVVTCTILVLLAVLFLEKNHH